MKKSATKIKQDQQVNENQVDMDIIAQEMATYFEQNISGRELIRWVTTIHSDEKIEESGEITEFISNMGWDFIPTLTTFKSKSSRVKYLKTAIIDVFNFGGYTYSKKALSSIGISYLTSFETLVTQPGEVVKFMQVYTTFLCLAEMYGDYEFHWEQLHKKSLIVNTLEQNIKF